MTGRSSLVASVEQVVALRGLAGSAVRGEADRARAVLLTLAGWTACEIGEAFGIGITLGLALLSVAGRD